MPKAAIKNALRAKKAVRALVMLKLPGGLRNKLAPL
jgi:hypothetical protein